MNYGFVSPHDLRKVTEGILVDMNNFTIFSNPYIPAKAQILSHDYIQDADLTLSYLHILRGLYNDA